MPLHLRFWALASHLPSLFGGSVLHRAALGAAAAADYPLADRLFEAAAVGYREHLMVPALARLRVHQIMVRAEACFTVDEDSAFEFMDEIERRLQALDSIEDLAPPFAEIRAEQMLARWTARFGVAGQLAA